MPNLIKTVDISSNNTVTLNTVNNWIGEGAQALIIRAYQTAELPGLQDVSRRMMQVAEQAGIWRLNYAWLYNTVSPERTVSDAVALIRSCGVNPGLLMLDCETYTNGNGDVLDPGPTVDQILAAANECRRQGVNPIIYTAGWWVASPWFQGDVNRLANIPVWYANYNADRSLATWPQDRFGAWARPLGHQYTSRPVDWSVFDYDWLAELARACRCRSRACPPRWWRAEAPRRLPCLTLADGGPASRRADQPGGGAPGRTGEPAEAGRPARSFGQPARNRAGAGLCEFGRPPLRRPEPGPSRSIPDARVRSSLGFVAARAAGRWQSRMSEQRVGPTTVAVWSDFCAVAPSPELREQMRTQLAGARQQRESFAPMLGLARQPRWPGFDDGVIIPPE